MNLYIFNETRRGAVYGIGTYIQELTHALNNTDFNICIIHLISDKPHIMAEKQEGVAHWYFPAPISEYWTTDDAEQRKKYHRNIVYLLQLFIKDQKDLLFHLNFPQGNSLIEELKNAFDSCKIISVSHFSDWGFTVFDNLQRLRNILDEKDSDEFGKQLKRSFAEERSYYEKADHCICLSNYMKDIVCQQYNVDAAKITLIPNGLNNRYITTDNCKLLRNRWNISAKEKIILFAGRMDEIKGLSYLIKAFQCVWQTYPQCRLVIAGAGDFNKYIGESQPICTKITYTGLLDKAQLYEWYSLADIGVVPSLFEPFGFVAVEMMMHQLPMVVTATSGMNEVVDDSCALKIPIVRYPDKVEIDSDLLAEKILYLLLHPKEARQLGRNGRKRYENNFTSEIFGQRMIRFYQSLQSGVPINNVL